MRCCVFWALALAGVSAWAQGSAAAPPPSVPIVAQVPAYTVNADFSNVANRQLLPKLTAAQQKLLAANTFLARPTTEEQFYYLYAQNAYHHLGSFITTDSVLHAFHVFSDSTLRTLENARTKPRDRPDAYILQEMSSPQVQRDFSLGLDLCAVLGSPRAAQLLDEVYQQSSISGYLPQRNKMQAAMRALTVQDWQQSLSYGWMYSLQPLFTPHGAGYPSFMRNTAWQDKSLVTALGSWTEQRHDTVSYANPGGAECDADSDAPACGYVEPEVGVYERLSSLLKHTKLGLQQRNMLFGDRTLGQRFDEFAGLLDFLAAAARKELRNEPLSTEDMREIARYGTRLESLMLPVSDPDVPGRADTWWDIRSTTGRDMALVTGVQTSQASMLEEAVGNAAELWVVVPIQGKLWLTRGATFTYYEFQHPAIERVTDVAWQERLRTGKAAPMPSWTHGYLLAPGPRTPVPTYPTKRED